MKEIFRYITGYFKKLNSKVFAACSLLTALMIYLNFHYEVDIKIDEFDSIGIRFLIRYVTFLIAFALPYLFYFLLEGKNYFKSPLILLLIFLSPAIFSWKMVMNTDLHLSNNNDWDYYWNRVIYWPARLIVLCLILFIIWKIFYSKESFFGLTIKGFNWTPYLIMLLIMVPLIAAASTQPDFLSMYPKLTDVDPVLSGVRDKWLYHLLHELSYGSDFISVELFFRGFLILAFIKVAGKDAILPMACFYCTIHFGKPLGECISSYFGGMILGIVVYNTRSIIGGLMVHLGIAWLMEIGGYIGNKLF
ncbi:MAG TPA: CPBP family glutamic-type intramembrane protease [Chitinophagaceae bacterium]|nr:CPBP family glutamic-type intramembrane protease [Chitinophagaceae bacterium]